MGRYNAYAILAIAGRLEIPAEKFHWSSRLPHEGQSSEMLVSLTKAVGGHTYMCGRGADGYQDERVFAELGIALLRQGFRHPVLCPGRRGRTRSRSVDTRRCHGHRLGRRTEHAEVVKIIVFRFEPKRIGPGGCLVDQCRVLSGSSSSWALPLSVLSSGPRMSPVRICPSLIRSCAMVLEPAPSHCLLDTKRMSDMKRIMTIVECSPPVHQTGGSIACPASAFQELIVHTGQHYDYKMSSSFFEELNIPKPDYNLNAGSDSALKQIAKMLERLDEVLRKSKPDCVIVFGDTNSAAGRGHCRCQAPDPRSAC